MAIGAAIGMGVLGTASAIGQFNQSKSSARAMKRQAEQEISNRKQEILKMAAKQKVSYVSAGLELEGTPQAVIQDTYNTGIDDVNAIKSSYNKAIKNTLTQARAQLLGNIVKTGTSAVSAYSGFGGSFGDKVTDVTGQASDIAAASGGQINFTNASYMG